MIINWVNRFCVSSLDALKPYKRVQKKTLDKRDNKLKNMLIEDSSVDTSAELVKKLEDEISCSIRKLGFIV
ncbi:hypothetical protein [Peptostreptococcus sp.]|uniref:hypothetical protein n=1 Tax=Peptostreptococcus sp. TaxID=1262 RepID=UPI001CAEC4C8|nr:hypothetical protein [Peptostreptococcus sp.]MBF1049979.1 hypothetical protein [Peptostreptococcus sp.]